MLGPKAQIQNVHKHLLLRECRDKLKDNNRLCNITTNYGYIHIKSQIGI